jgi:hypothetical protein
MSGARTILTREELERHIITCGGPGSEAAPNRAPREDDTDSLVSGMTTLTTSSLASFFPSRHGQRRMIDRDILARDVSRAIKYGHYTPVEGGKVCITYRKLIVIVAANQVENATASDEDVLARRIVIEGDSAAAPSRYGSAGTWSRAAPLPARGPAAPAPAAATRILVTCFTDDTIRECELDEDEYEAWRQLYRLMYSEKPDAEVVECFRSKLVEVQAKITKARLKELVNYAGPATARGRVQPSEDRCFTLLCLAALRRSADIMSLLLDASADPTKFSMEDKHGRKRTPLHLIFAPASRIIYAPARGGGEHASPRVNDHWGMNLYRVPQPTDATQGSEAFALYVVLQDTENAAMLDCLRTLLAHYPPGDVNRAVDTHKMTPLHRALYPSLYTPALQQAAQMLVDAGADVALLSKYRETAADLARAVGCRLQLRDGSFIGYSSDGPLPLLDYVYFGHQSSGAVETCTVKWCADPALKERILSVYKTSTAAAASGADTGTGTESHSAAETSPPSSPLYGFVHVDFFHGDIAYCEHVGGMRRAKEIAQLICNDDVGCLYICSGDCMYVKHWREAESISQLRNSVMFARGDEIYQSFVAPRLVLPSAASTVPPSSSSSSSSAVVFSFQGAAASKATA